MINKYPIIYDADSSQHSAIIDAVKGKNLIIEGPPGTGKSQTITNIIAALINDGKKVLFVAEKMAALNVVKNKLDKAGLGNFCLELHSNKTNKKSFLEDLKSSIINFNKSNYSNKINFITRYNELHEKLKNYSELVNDFWCDSGLTIHEIFCGAVKHK